MTSETGLQDRMARAIAAAMHHSQEGAEPGKPVMADRRLAAHAAAEAALACIEEGDLLGNGLKASLVRDGSPR